MAKKSEQAAIIPYLPHIFETLFKHGTVIVKSPPGSGKSLFMPTRLAMQGYRVFVGMPTIAAVMVAAKNVKSMDEFKSLDIGTHAESKADYTDKTNVVYIIYKSLYNKMLKSIDSKTGEIKDITFCDVIVFDESHSTDVNNYLILKLFKYIKDAGRKVPMDILTTATIDEVYISKIYPHAGVVVIEGRAFDIDVRYSSRDYNEYRFDEKSYFFQDFIRTILTAISICKGNVLVFFPGVGEINKTYDYLNLKHKDSINDMLVPLIYSGCDDRDMDLLKADSTPKRLLVLATNIVETSVTVKNLDVVVDSMLEKRNQPTDSGGLALLDGLVVQASAIQRAGRSGRDHPGIAYRMITRSKFETLEKNNLDDIQRLPIEKDVMGVITARLDPYKFFFDVSKTKLDNAITNLSMLGCILKSEGKVYATEKGVFVGDLQLGLKLASALYDWYGRGYNIADGIVMMCMISGGSPSYFFIPKQGKDEPDRDYQKKRQQHVEHYFTKYMAHDDPETYIKLWNDFFVDADGKVWSDGALKKYCKANSISEKSLRNAVNDINTTVNSISRKTHQEIKVRKIDPSINVLRLLPILAFNFRDKITFASGGEFVDVKGMEYKMDNKVGSVRAKRDLNMIPILYMQVADTTRVSCGISYSVNRLYNI